MSGLSAESAHHKQTLDDQNQDPSALTESNVIISLLILLLNKVATHVDQMSHHPEAQNHH